MGKLNLDIPIQLGARKIAVKSFKMLTLKTWNLDGNRKGAQPGVRASKYAWHAFDCAPAVNDVNSKGLSK